MRRVLIGAMVISAIFCSCNNKVDKGTESTEAQAAVQADTLTDVDRYEGKVVESETGEWFVIKDGLRWRAMSEPATTDYLNSIADGKNHVARAVPNKTLEQFPIGGEILPKLKYVQK